MAGSIIPLLSHWVCCKLCPREFGVLRQRSMSIGLLWKWWSLQYCTFSKIKNIQETIENLWQTNLPSKRILCHQYWKGLWLHFDIFTLILANQHLHIYQRNKILSKSLDCYCPQLTSKANIKLYGLFFFLIQPGKNSESKQRLFICRETSDSCYSSALNNPCCNSHRQHE